MLGVVLPVTVTTRITGISTYTFICHKCILGGPYPIISCISLLWGFGCVYSMLGKRSKHILSNGGLMVADHDTLANNHQQKHI